jgi:uncharacterized protein
MKNFDIVVYHNPCSDGFASMWSALKYNSLIIAIPCKAGDVSSLSLDLFDGKRVLFVDICPIYDEILAISEKSVWVTILDHHKSAMDMCVNKYNCGRYRFASIQHSKVEYDIDMSRAGCQITWDYFFPHISPVKNRPWFINYIADRDLWQFKLKWSKEINAALFDDNYFTIDKMNALTNEDMDMLRDKGIELLSIQEKKIANLCSTRVQCTFTINNVTYNVWLSDCEYSHRSEVGNALCKIPFIDGNEPNFAVIWCFDPKSSDIWVSLRGIDKVDLNQLSKQYDEKGGGHFNAAGFTIRNKKINDIFIPC